ncbi:MAG: S1 RNA-binding domain-containing protein [Candidatus Aegiribacteria sp.]|nr:S1 RNA-binding domain-containing protein [Candidatus Aegiribacteria sp.]MBD3295625.1 S1 RNA-binding domain-containing protein [Candidatus Fermentibacteria bacterium]
MVQPGLAPRIASELSLKSGNVAAVAELLASGATVPFIARYRKEASGGMDEVLVIQVRDRLDQLEKLDKRRRTVLASLEERDLLNSALKEKIDSAESLTDLEDIYLPFRPRRRTRASKAREKGLEPLARAILDSAAPLGRKFPERFVDPQRGVESVDEALAGARDIIAERVAHDPSVRGAVRMLFWNTGRYECSVIPGMEEKGAKYRDYFRWSGKLTSTPSHRVHAIERAEREKVISVIVSVDFERALRVAADTYCRDTGARPGPIFMDAAEDSLRRLIIPSMENETRRSVKNRADREAIKVFSRNLKDLLLAPPLGSQAVLAVDPGYRTGCKTVCLDKEGELQETAVLFPFGSEKQRVKAEKDLRRLLKQYSIEYIAVGNGTAGRETERFLQSKGFSDAARIVSVNESGASVYSASKVAREEFPDLDVTFRGAVSIGRRLQDPLAELVKIDPKSIGVGQYQHDVDGKMLQKALEDTVVSCVNSVGVDVNTASPQLLSYVSGLSLGTAGRITEWRSQNGPFRSREQLKEVRGLGPVTFQQCAGFLRIRNGYNPLDASRLHPENYPVVNRMVRSLECSFSEFLESSELRASVNLQNFVCEKAGMPTLLDMMEELDKPGRDPRKTFKAVKFADVHTLEDLKKDMVLPGLVTNVTNFGAFVDIGVHRDGLVHISQMADEFVSDPSSIVSVGQAVRVRVMEVDAQRKRISLTMLL